MSRICLDTSAYSHFMRGAARAVEVIRAAQWIGIPAVVLGELRAGFLQGGQAVRNEEELIRFLSHPLVKVLDVDAAASAIYARWRPGRVPPSSRTTSIFGKLNA
jgi:tRNA(fMet)-specific endonuclease VapC